MTRGTEAAPRGPRRSDPVREQAGLIGGRLIRRLLLLALLVVVVVEGGAVVINRLQANDIAEQAAAEAGIAYSTSGSLDQARQEAVEYVTRSDATLLGVELDQPNRTMTITVEKRASTRFVDDIAALERYTVARGRGTVPLRR